MVVGISWAKYFWRILGLLVVDKCHLCLDSATMEQLMSSFEQFGLVVQYYVAVIALDMYILVNANIMYRGGSAGAS